MKYGAENIRDFFIKNKYIILAAFAAGIYAHSLAIWTFKFGIDSAAAALDVNGVRYLNEQRWGAYILHLAFPFLQYHIVSNIFGIAALTLSAVLILSGHNIPSVAKLIFCISVVSYPAPAHLEYFYYQFGYNSLAVLFAVLAYKITETVSKPALIPAVALLSIGIGTYQSVMAVFLSAMMINAILDHIDGKPLSIILKHIVKSTVILIIAVAVYFIIVKLLPYQISRYHLSFLQYKSGNIPKKIMKMLQTVQYMAIGGDKYKFALHRASFIAICAAVIIAAFKWKNLKKIAVFIFLIIGLYLAVFSVNIALGHGAIRARSMVSLAFFFGTPFMLILMIAENKILKAAAITAGIYCAMTHTDFISKLYTSHILQYEQDKIISARILDGIYDIAPEIYDGKYKIAIIGNRIKNPADHNLRYKYETAGQSFYYWGNGDPDRIIRFLYLLGLPLNVKLAGGDTLHNPWGLNPNVTVSIGDEKMNKVKEIADSMPKWPDKNSIQVYEDIVIIHLR